jgi:hypothetical protein
MAGNTPNGCEKYLKFILQGISKYTEICFFLECNYVCHLATLVWNVDRYIVFSTSTFTTIFYPWPIIKRMSLRKIAIYCFKLPIRCKNHMQNKINLKMKQLL